MVFTRDRDFLRLLHASGLIPNWYMFFFLFFSLETFFGPNLDLLFFYCTFCFCFLLPNPLFRLILSYIWGFFSNPRSNYSYVLKIIQYCHMISYDTSIIMFYTSWYTFLPYPLDLIFALLIYLSYGCKYTVM